MNVEDLEKYLDGPEKIHLTRIALIGSFELYLKFMFLTINSSKVFIELFHLKVISALENLVLGKNKKTNLGLNIPVGSGKSLLVQYFITWCYARNIDCANLYISHSSILIGKLSKESKDIVEHPIWKLLFNAELKKDEKSKINWGFAGAKKRTGLMAGTMGGAITGLDAGNPNIEGFSGALIIDDPIDVGNINHELQRDECNKFYTDKLETRKRTPTTPTILIMQRLHKKDLTGYLKDLEPEEWDFLTVPALQDDGTSFWEARYPVNYLTKMQEINAYKFYSQYQQNPTTSGGTVIKTKWFGYCENYNKVKFKRLFMTGDTAQKTKEHNDYTVFGVWGIDEAFLYLIDLVRGKWEAPELLEEAHAIWNKWKAGINGKLFTSFNIEDKVSGTGLIQTLKRKSRIPVRPISRGVKIKGRIQKVVDKLTRVEDTLPILQCGKVLLPVSKTYKFNPVFIEECEGFQRDMTHKHDDIIDNLCDAVSIFQKGFSREDLL